VLCYYLLFVTLLFHSFWMCNDLEARNLRAAACVNNITLLGGLMLIVVQGPGLLSVSNLAGRSVRPAPHETIKPR
jgi:uncharacterized membrane protein YphA (DoxX/SURF4 family)